MQGEKIQTDYFTIPGDDTQWYFDLLPQGLETSKKFKGHVAIMLCSKDKVHDKVALECLVKKNNEKKSSYVNANVSEDSVKAKKLYPHVHCVAAVGVAHNDLKNPAKLLLKDDVLVLYMKITIRGEEKTITKISPIESSVNEDVEMAELCGRMVEMWRRHELTDVVVNCGTEIFHCHRLVLAARSPVLKAMFVKNEKEGVENIIDVSELDVETAKDMIRYMYTGTVKDLKFKATRLLEAANKFNLPQLKIMAERNIIFNLSIHQALDLFLLADIHNAEDLRIAAKQMIVNNCSVVVEQEGWKDKLENHTSLMFEIFEAMANTT